SALHRLRLPNINSGLEAPPPALLAMRIGCANLIKALDNTLNAAGAIGQRPRATKLAGIPSERNEITEQRIQLDKRPRGVEDAKADVWEAAMQADGVSDSNLSVQQVGLVNVYVRTLDVEISSARFETGIDDRLEAPGAIDLTALSRSVESIREITGD